MRQGAGSTPEQQRQQRHQPLRPSPDTRPDTSPPPPSDDEWAAALSRACERGEVDCAVCLAPLARREGQDVAALSCSHVFHGDCIAAFEAFEMCRGGVASCPVCRQAYSRRVFAVSAGAAEGGGEGG
jgi:hypothetical protein